MTVDEMEFGLRQIAVRRKNALLFGEEVLLNKAADFIAALPANLAKPVPASGWGEAAAVLYERHRDRCRGHYGKRIMPAWKDALPETQDLYREDVAALASSTPAEAEARTGEAVAEVLWYDPRSDHNAMMPRKIIDGSFAFMDDVPIGTKLYAAPPATAPDAGMVEAAIKAARQFTLGALTMDEHRDVVNAVIVALSPEAKERP